MTNVPAEVSITACFGVVWAMPDDRHRRTPTAQAKESQHDLSCSSISFVSLMRYRLSCHGPDVVDDARRVTDVVEGRHERDRERRQMHDVDNHRTVAAGS